MRSLKGFLKKLVPDGIRSWIVGLPFVANMRYRLFHHLVIRPRLRRQLSFLDSAAVAKPPATRRKKILVPLIETSHYQHFHVLILAKALQLRGADVRVLICGQSLDGCEIKSVRNSHVGDACWRCRFNEHHALREFGLSTVRLSDVLSARDREELRITAQSLMYEERPGLTRHGVALDQAVNDSVTRYFYGAIPHDRSRIAAVRRDHVASALMSIEAARRLDDEWSPDVVLTHMYCYSPWEPFFKYFQQRGGRFQSVSISQFDFRSLVLSSFELFESTERFERYVATRTRSVLAQHERDALQAFLAERMGGNSQIFRQDGYFDTMADGASVAQRLTIDRSKRNIFLFSNVYWDVGLSDCGALYKDVLAWVLETIELVRDRPDCHLYVKPHPAEVFDSSSSLKGVSQIIRERYPVLPSNVTVIEPEWKINTYQLFSFIDAGVIFNGTIGLEMMLAAIPVISTGRTTYQGLDFATEPDTVEQYRDALLGVSAPRALDRERLELFAYFYFLRTLIPWRLTKQSYGDDFDGFTIDALEDLKPGRDPYLDHLCTCILDRKAAVAEAWQDEISCRDHEVAAH
jgi:hypothetical protein